MSKLLQVTGTSASADARLAEIIAEITDKLHAGESVDVEAYAARHPELATRLRHVLPALALVEGAGASGSEAGSVGGNGDAVTGTLGDFRIVREIGRGGMGVVYEAEQISLRRRVALKVLPFAATMDPRQLQRFHNEARAAASLEHPHIVPVYGVGSERGVHYYAMKFIEEQSLAEVIADLRLQNADMKKDAKPLTGPSDAAAVADRSKPAADRRFAICNPKSVNAATAPIALATTERAPRDAAAFRLIAAWGIQAAEALEHAHSVGIVHRDIKPANLMIDRHGALWVTDFGLARTAADAGLTITGDVLGTLRYMSPEQAMAKHGLVDHRTDVYSLGVTLYELLTGTPAVKGADREEILNAITIDEPRPSRVLDAAIPRDLETIVLKAMAKESGDRYASAQEFAADLGRFLQDKPIMAKRHSLAKRVRSYIRRHQGAAWCASAGMTAALIVLAVSSLLLWQEKEQVKTALAEKDRQHRLAEEQAAAAEKQRRRAEFNFGKALDGMTLVLQYLDKKEWPQPVDVEQVSLDLAQQFEFFFQRARVENKDEPLAQLEIGWAFQHLGVFYIRRGDRARAEQHFRTALTLHEALASHFPDDRAHVWMYAQSLSRLGELLHLSGRTGEAHGYLLRAAEQYRRQVRIVSDWKAYHDLAWFLVNCPDTSVRDPAEAIRAASQAVELNPDLLECQSTLGRAFYRNGDYHNAVAVLQDCVGRGDMPHDWFFLAMVRWKLGGHEQARKDFDRGVQVFERYKRPSVTVQEIRAEAASLLAIDSLPTPKTREDAPGQTLKAPSH